MHLKWAKFIDLYLVLTQLSPPTCGLLFHFLCIRVGPQDLSKSNLAILLRREGS